GGLKCSEIVDHLSVVAITETILPVEKVSGVAFRSHDHRVVVLRKDESIEPLHAEGRLQKRTVRECGPLRSRNEEAALTKVRRHIHCVEGVQIDERQVLRKDRKDRRKVIVRVDVVIDLSERVEGFEFRIVRKVRQRRYAGAYEAVFERLRERELIFDYRPGDYKARREGFQPHDLAFARVRVFASAKTRKEVREEVLPIVAAGARTYGGHCAGELSVLRRIWA